LRVDCEVTSWPGGAAADWVVYLRNEGDADTLLLEDIQGMDFQVRPPAGDVTLRHSHGSGAAETDFLPLETELPPGGRIGLAPEFGRSSDGVLPFFHLTWAGGGVVGAVGWSGQWALEARRDDDGTVTLRAGQEKTRLRPGETVRTPRMLLAAWRGMDPITGHNQFRRLLLDQYVPRVGGEIALPPVTLTTWFTHEAHGGTEAN
jgi:alpha-galactosidase